MSLELDANLVVKVELLKVCAWAEEENPVGQLGLLVSVDAVDHCCLIPLESTNKFSHYNVLETLAVYFDYLLLYFCVCFQSWPSLCFAR